jgi:hypothetical protein
MQCISSPLPSHPNEGSEGYNHISQFNMCCCTDTYHTNIRLRLLISLNTGTVRDTLLKIWRRDYG